MSDHSLPTNHQPDPPEAGDQVRAPEGLEALQARVEEYLKGWQRAKADYANLKRETELKFVELTRFANEDLLRELLPLVDYFKHALRAIPSDQRGQPWLEGIRHIQSKLEQVLAYYGVKELEVMGERFDPALHEAVAEIENTQAPSGTIVEEVRTGFMLHNKLLQAARVKLAK